MRYTDFKLTEDELLELKMSPTNLSKMAKDIDARVGLEFELIVPNVEGEEEEYESEPDYDADESFPIGAGWRRDVMSFFRGGSNGSSSAMINRALDNLDEDFWSWMGDQEEDFISSPQGQERAIAIATNNVDRDDYESDEEYEAAVRDYLDTNEDRIRDELSDEFREDLDAKFEEWLDEVDIRSMSQFADQYNLDWPYWTEPEYYGGGNNISVDEVADDFSQAIGRPVNASRSYHGATRQPGRYVVEPDGSLEGDAPGDSGLEFVSPPLTVDEMMSDIDKVAKWAGRVGAYTNESTGLHMNVSVPNQENLDFVKLAMFLGDNYILEQFGREGNTYCKSILKQIISTARSDPSRVEEMMRQFQGGLNQLASKVLHTGSTGKYSSINNRGGWIEFRSPGGDWLGEDLSAVKNTLLRAVVATDVATKPEEFKQEYYKKLYKTLTQGKEDDTIQYFAKYAAGELPKQALKSFVRQIQTQRSIKKQGPGANERYWWNVKYNGQRIEVVATNAEEAKRVAAREWGEPFLVGVLDRMTAEPIRPYQEPARTVDTSSGQEFAGAWQVVDRDTNQVVHVFDANRLNDPRSVRDAEQEAAAYVARMLYPNPVYVRPVMRDSSGQLQRDPTAAGQAEERQRLAAQMPRLDLENGNWEVYSLSSNNSVYRFTANTEEEAGRAFDIWQTAIRNPSMPREGFNLRAVRPQGTAQTQAQGTGSLPPGNQRWLVLDRNGNEVYSFINTTYQSDANQYALQWMTRSAPDDVRQRGPFEVVPAR